MCAEPSPLRRERRAVVLLRCAGVVLRALRISRRSLRGWPLRWVVASSMSCVWSDVSAEVSRWGLEEVCDVWPEYRAAEVRWRP